MARASDIVGGRYQLDRIIGTGGMAGVWAAHDRQGGGEVAVKILADNLSHDATFVARFEREAEVAKGLQHPNLVAALDSGRHQGSPYLVMELVTGGTLAKSLREHGPKAVDSGALAVGLLAALAHIHRAGIVHRDVKPANVLLDSAGVIKLTDFGIAVPDQATSLTRTGQVIGTLDYMAPEVSRGDPADARSDLYSAGVVIRETLGPDESPELVALVADLTSADREARPESASLAAAALAATHPLPADDTPTQVMVAPTVPMTPAPSKARRSWWPAAALGLAIAAVVAIALASGGSEDGGGNRSPTNPDTEPTTQTEPQASVPEPEPDPAPAPTPEPEPAPTDPGEEIPCEELKAAKDQLEDEEKTAREAAGDDKEAEEATKDDYKQREEALNEREEACKEAEKEAENNGKKE